jgi:periplasmic protein CpxP/Spy
MMRSMRNLHGRWTLAAGALLLGTLPLLAQSPGGPGSGGPGSGGTGSGGAGAGSFGPHRPPLERAFRLGPHGRWWNNPQIAQKIGLTEDQQKKMDDIFLQSRLKLIDQHAAVEKEEAILEPMLSTDQPDEAQVLSQIDKVAQSRAELEKANARMLLGLRRVLTTAQWQQLRTLERHGRDGTERRGGADSAPPANPPGGEGGL